MQKEVTGVVDQFVELILDLIRVAVNFFVTNFVQLFQAMPSQPWWKWLIVLIVLGVIVFYLWHHIVAFFMRLIDAAVALLYAIPGLVVLGLVAFLANWFVRNVHSPRLDSAFAGIF